MTPPEHHFAMTMETWISRVDERLDTIQGRLVDLERLSDIQRRLSLLEDIPARVAVIEERCRFRGERQAAGVSGRWALYAAGLTGVLGLIAALAALLT